ncbi:MAG: hypothetical protein ACYCTV_01870 [Leptospirales bacterium]
MEIHGVVVLQNRPHHRHNPPVAAVAAVDAAECDHPQPSEDSSFSTGMIIRPIRFFMDPPPSRKPGRLSGLFLPGLLLVFSQFLTACHFQTSSPLEIRAGNPQFFQFQDMTFLLVPLEVTDRGSRTLRVHVRHTLLDLSTKGEMNFRLRGSGTYDYILHHADKPFETVYPMGWPSIWVNHSLSHKDVVVPAVHKMEFPLLFIYRGRLSSATHMTIHLVYSYPQTATNDELLIDVPTSPPNN